MCKVILILTAVALLAVLAGCDFTQLERSVEQAEHRLENALDPEPTRPQAETTPTQEVPPQTVETPAETSPTQAPVTPTEAQKLSQEEAENIALAYVGFTREQVERLRSEFDYDDGQPEYEVNFYAEDMEYEFEIHAESGKILSFDKESIYD